MRRLEPEEEMSGPEGRGYVRHAPAFLPIKAKGSLFEMALSAMRKSFAERNHFPSTAQWEALEAVVRNVEQMADGTLKQVAYLSSLDPGVGKTQSVIHSVRALLKLERYSDIGVIICLGRSAEIQTIVREMRLADEQFAVLVANKKENSHLNSMGNPDNNQARVLLTTQQMLESRSKEVC
jgi:hypothetical protein